MDLLYRLCDQFSETLIAQQWRSVLDLYTEIERRTMQFQSDYHVYCPPECGTCCEHFVPEITELEATLIAAYILWIKNDTTLIDRLVAHTPTNAECPLYDPSSAFHCRIYPVRGMICRLFGACPSSDKVGLPVFRKCKYNQDESQPSRYESQDFREHLVPTMQQFAVQFSTLSPSQNTLVLNKAVLQAVERLQFLASYINSGPTDDSDPFIPTPLAS